MSENSRNFGKSDDLVRLIELIDQFMPNQGIQPFIQFQIIVDANIVLQDIKYLLTKAVSRDVRTGFLELLEVQAIKCYAPTFLEHEIAEKVPVLAEKYQFSSEDGLLLWRRFSKHIEFVEVGAPKDAPVDARDPKDWPYIALQEILEHPIVTNDKDISGMGGLTARFTIVASLRTYARESANAMSIMVYGGIAVSIPTVVLFEASLFLSRWTAQNIRTLPKWLWIAGAILVGLLLVYPPSRVWLRQKMSTLAASSKSAAISLFNAIEPIIESFENSRESAAKALQEANNSVAV